MFYVNGGKADYSANICSHLAGESMVRQKVGDVICTPSTLLDRIHLYGLIEDLILDWIANILLIQRFCFVFEQTNFM